MIDAVKKKKLKYSSVIPVALLQPSCLTNSDLNVGLMINRTREETESALEGDQEKEVWHLLLKQLPTQLDHR